MHTKATCYMNPTLGKILLCPQAEQPNTAVSENRPYLVRCCVTKAVVSVL